MNVKVQHAEMEEQIRNQVNISSQKSSMDIISPKANAGVKPLITLGLMEKVEHWLKNNQRVMANAGQTFAYPTYESNYMELNQYLVQGQVVMF